MPSPAVKVLTSATTAVCIVVALFCPWGFLAAFEPGQDAFRIIYPALFVAAVVLGSLSYRVAKG